MSEAVYKKIKRQKGERFARVLRDHHNGLLEIPDIARILRHAGRDDAEKLLPYLMSLMAANDNTEPEPEQKPKDPFVLLEQAGYNAFYADTLKKQNSIKSYFQPGRELLCTFNDAARYLDYHIVHAVREDADHLNRADFKGKEDRQDAYGTSVISIQMLKDGGFIKITNRYNHSVSGCDHTFGSNPDNIIDGLSRSLKDHFNVDFSANGSPLPVGYTVIDDQIFKYNFEDNNIYYGDQAWAKNGEIHEINRARGDALFGEFVFDNKTKTLCKIDPESQDSFADDFNRFYGGNKDLHVKDGNLYLGEDILIGAQQSKITSLSLPAFTDMSDGCLVRVPYLTKFEANSLITMGNNCLLNVPRLTRFEAPALTTMGDACLLNAEDLTKLHAPALIAMGNFSLRDSPARVRLACWTRRTLNTIGNTFENRLENTFGM